MILVLEQVEDVVHLRVALDSGQQPSDEHPVAVGAEGVHQAAGLVEDGPDGLDVAGQRETRMGEDEQLDGHRQLLAAPRHQRRFQQRRAQRRCHVTAQPRHLKCQFNANSIHSNFLSKMFYI